MSYFYKYFGLVFKVDFPLVGEETGECAYDVEVVLGEVPKEIPEGSKYKHHYILKDNQIIINIRRLAYYHIESSKRIVIEPIGDVNMEGIVTYFYGPCLSSLLIKRGWMPLHGSAVVYDGKTYLVVGHSGAGKSTFSAALAMQGGKIISDDIILVKPEGNDYLTMKGSATQKLWIDTINALGLSSDGLMPLAKGKNKFYLLGNETDDEGMYKIDAMIVVEKSHKQQVQLLTLSGKERLERYIGYTFWRGLINEIIGEAEFFKHAVGLTNHLPVYCIKRPINGFTVDQQLSIFQREIHR